jgi:hypothetical protein
MELYLSNKSVILTKPDITTRITELYNAMDKPLPHITWYTLTDVKNEFFEETEIITTIGNINWVYFYTTFINLLAHDVTEVNKTMFEIYDSKHKQFDLLYDVMFNIFGFIELEDELILIEKPEKFYDIDDNLEFHSLTGPVIEIGDLREYFIHGVNVTRLEWSKRLRIALIDSTDELIKEIDLDTLNKIRNEVFAIEGNNVKNINEPKVIVFYLDREILNNREIVHQFAKSVDKVFDERHFNALAFFLPTDGDEHVECINPQLISKEDYQKVIEVLETSKKLFDIGNIKDE